MWSNHLDLRHMTRRLVCKLKKALYGLKQVRMTWYNRMDNFLNSLGFTKSKADSNLYYKVEEGNPVILLLYVDDLYVKGEDGYIFEKKGILLLSLKCRSWVQCTTF